MTIIANSCMLNKIFNMHSSGKEKKCPRCGKLFICECSPRCWCTKYTISSSVRDSLEAQFADCLCEDCLKLYSGKQKQP
ncbi:MAG: cysteine-rich CWC family protein [Bacteroidota bacterium]